jgi:hypothetical protein
VKDGKLPPSRDEDGRVVNSHTLGPVYTVMLRQIARDYSGLPDARTLTLDQIRWFYDGLIHEISSLPPPRNDARKRQSPAPRR